MLKIVQNNKTNSTELHDDKGPIASWNTIDIPEESIPQIEHMLRIAIDEGKNIKAREIRNLITGTDDNYWKY